MKSELNINKRFAFLNIAKWFFASVLIGAAVGVTNGLFLKLLAATIGFASQSYYYFLVLPFGLYIVNILARKVAPRDIGYSTNEAIGAINDKKPISLISAAKAFFLPIITIGAGGSAGKESPCADVGAGLGALFAKLFSFNPGERRKLMICGVSAGFAGVFGVPISGALFGLEVLSVGTVFYEVMFPAFIAGITSYQITMLMGVEYIYHPMALGALGVDSVLLFTVVAGIFFGLVSLLFMEVLKVCRIVFRFIGRKYSMFWKVALASAGIILIGLLAGPDYLGLGMTRVDSILAGQDAPWTGFLLKMLTTGLTFAGGGVGGAITPVMFIGACAGHFFADILGLSTVTFAALGIVAILAGVCNTPLAASVMAIELFGATVAPYAAVCCIVSFLVTGRRSIYGKQRFAFDKDISDDDLADGATPRRRHGDAQRAHNHKDFFLYFVRHLIPDVKHNRRREEPAPPPPSQDAGEAKKRRSLFSHLLPKLGDLPKDK